MLGCTKYKSPWTFSLVAPPSTCSLGRQLRAVCVDLEALASYQIDSKERTAVVRGSFVLTDPRTVIHHGSQRGRTDSELGRCALGDGTRRCDCLSLVSGVNSIGGGWFCFDTSSDTHATTSRSRQSAHCLQGTPTRKMTCMNRCTRRNRVKGLAIGGFANHGALSMTRSIPFCTKQC
jgi:hypothetical protein